ncbi:DNA polymerase [Anaerovirgula multivorans]|uniref:DNA polymerase n=1 Tax=Anaerovirgula multivorans TaxID=312168 RepID=UPI0015954B52|nr:DNA polymerase [Anaerovirgula multivorans]
MDELCEWLSKLSKLGKVAIDTETMGLDWWKDEIVGISFYAPHRGYYIPLKHKDHVEEGAGEVGVDYVKCLDKTLVASRLKPLLERYSLKTIWHNYCFDWCALKKWLGIVMPPAYFDTIEGQSLLDENEDKQLKPLAEKYLRVPADTYSKIFGSRTTFDTVPILLNPATRTGNLSAYYATKDTELTYKLAEFQEKHLNMPHLSKIKSLMFNISMPFLDIVKEATYDGVRTDVEYLVGEVSPKLHAGLDELEAKIKAVIGDINLNSPAQLAPVFYDKLQLPKMNKKKPNSTDKKTMAKLMTGLRIFTADLEGTLKRIEAGEQSDEIYYAKLFKDNLPYFLKPDMYDKAREYFKMCLDLLQNITTYRKQSKLTSAFADSLPTKLDDDRIHPNFKPSHAVTWRMSCANPNFQNLPSKDGGMIRRAFIADEGRLLASIDASQQELRWLAHLSKDPVLLDAFATGKDIHSITATSIYNRLHPEKQVTYEDFQAYRGLIDKFTDADGGVDSSKITNADIATLYDEKLIVEPTEEAFVEAVDFGKYLDFIRSAKAKATNFSVVYGTTQMGLADNLLVTAEAAEGYINAFYDTYKGVARWMTVERKKILKTKFAESYGGKKRRLYPEIGLWERDKSYRHWDKKLQRGELGSHWALDSAYRQGINSLIQTPSAYQIKKASIDMQPLLKELDCKIILWVHDEQILDVPENIGMDNLRRIADVLCNTIQLDCGMKSDIEVGRRWSQKMSDDEVDSLREGDFSEC